MANDTELQAGLYRRAEELRRRLTPLQLRYLDSRGLPIESEIRSMELAEALEKRTLN